LYRDVSPKLGFPNDYKAQWCTNTVIAVGDRMILGMQDFDFAKSIHSCPNFASIFPKPLIKFVQI